MRIHDRLTRKLLKRNRTVTAAESPTPVACKKCGCSQPADRLWGINSDGITTAELAKVAYWVCEQCFVNPNRAATQIAAELVTTAADVLDDTPSGGVKKADSENLSEK